MNATESIWELIDFIGGSINNEDDDRYSAPRRAEDASEGGAE